MTSLTLGVTGVVANSYLGNICYDMRTAFLAGNLDKARQVNVSDLNSVYFIYFTTSDIQVTNNLAKTALIDTYEGAFPWSLLWGKRLDDRLDH